jgi:hypothetical protein
VERHYGETGFLGTRRGELVLTDELIRESLRADKAAKAARAGKREWR